MPLSAIQAEIEWAYGEGHGGPDDFYYEEGDATIPPLPLSDITSYFQERRRQGRRNQRWQRRR